MGTQGRDMGRGARWLPKLKKGLRATERKGGVHPNLGYGTVSSFSPSLCWPQGKPAQKGLNHPEFGGKKSTPKNTAPPSSKLSPARGGQTPDWGP